jgi:hypothetical protein
MTEWRKSATSNRLDNVINLQYLENVFIRSKKKDKKVNC